MKKRYSAEDEAFWQKLIRPQEEHECWIGWNGIGYRWFRSENVLCLEHYRQPESLPQRKAS
jgi:hypothetical protein